MTGMERYKKAFAEMPPEIREAEVNKETHDAVTVYMDMGRLADVQVSRQIAMYIRVTGEKTGCYYTQDIGEDALDALKKAYENSFYGENEPEKILTDKSKMVLGGKRACSDVKQLTDTAVGLMKKAMAELPVSEDVIHAEASLKAETLGQHTVNSHGVDVQFASPLYIFSMTVNIKDNDTVQTADVSLAASDPQQIDAAKAGKELWLKCRAQRGNQVSLEPGRYPAILGNSVVYYMFGTAWQIFSGCKYREEATALRGKLGQKISSSCLEIQDMTDCSHQGFPMYCDCEGNTGQDISLIKDGKLKNLLHNIASAHALKQPCTGNAGRRPLLYGNIATEIQVTPKNFCILPGKVDLDAMMAHMGDGILVTESFDIFHTIDISSGDFSIPCLGILIREGKETGQVVSLTMTGNICDLLSDVLEVGDNFLLHPMVALENYGIGSCPLRISGISFS